MSAPLNPSCPPTDENKKSRQSALNDVVKSIADEERAMAELMNKEAEKIKNVANHPASTVDDMLKINDSAGSVIEKITTTNEALAKKLEKVINSKP